MPCHDKRTPLLMNRQKETDQIGLLMLEDLRQLGPVTY